MFKSFRQHSKDLHSLVNMNYLTTFIFQVWSAQLQLSYLKLEYGKELSNTVAFPK